MRFLCALFFLTCCSSALAAPPGEVTVDQLVSLAPVLKGDDPAIQRLHVRGTQLMAVNDPLYYFDFTLEKPNHCSLVMWDGLDDIPILIAVDGKVMFYDAGNSTIETLAAWPSFYFLDNGDKFQMGFILTAGRDTPNAKATIFDIKSVVDRFTNDRKLKDLEKGAWEFTGRSQRGSILTCLVVPDQKLPYKRVAIRMADPSAPQVTLEQIDLNYDKTKLTPMPNLQELKAPIPIHEVKEPPSLVKKSVEGTFRSLVFRRAIYRPPYRDDPMVKSQNFIDWAAARERDELAAKALNGLAMRERSNDNSRLDGGKP